MQASLWTAFDPTRTWLATSHCSVTNARTRPRCGDIVAATLALVGLAGLQTRAGTPLVWIFNLWGSADLLHAFYQGYVSGLQPGDLGAGYFIPTFIVPMLLITHALVFRILLQRTGSKDL